jgi:hypothetical protein
VSAGQTIRMFGENNRRIACRMIRQAPEGAVVNIAPPRRTSDQNSKLWAMLSDISRAKPEGRDLPPDIWKCIFMSAAGFKCRFEPSLDGDGVVPIGFKSSRLSKAEFSELIECVAEYGARCGVEWSEQ